MASTTVINATLTRLASNTRLRIPVSPWIIPAVVATTLGQGPAWMPHIYNHVASAVNITHTDHDANGRLIALHSQLREALFKTAILVGVPKVIETLLALGQAVPSSVRDKTFVRRGVGDSLARRAEAGDAGLGTVYQDDLTPIFDKMDEAGMEDVKWMSRHVTYGTFLTPYSSTPIGNSDANADPLLSLDQRLLSVVTLSALVPQRTPREILWHLRGALRRGLTRDDVEALHEAIEEVCEACGSRGVREGMPRLEEVERQKEEAD